MAEIIENRTRYRATFIVIPGLGPEEVTLGVTYDEDESEWQDGKDGEIDYSRNFQLDCSKEKAQEVLSFLTDKRFF